LQFTALGASTIDGFQGRYLYPLLPLLFLNTYKLPRPLLGIKVGWYVLGLGIFGLGATMQMTYNTYL